MALAGELTPQEQEIVDFFAGQDFGPFPTRAEEAVKEAQKMYDQAQVDVDKLPAFDPKLSGALRTREVYLVQLLRAKAFRAVVANRYTDPVKGPKGKLAKQELSLASQYRGDPTDFLTLATNLDEEIRTKTVNAPSRGAEYRQSDSFTAASALASTDPVPSTVGPVISPRPAQGAVGQTAAITPSAQPTSAAQFRMAEQAAGQPTAATMADVQRRKPAARATRKPPTTTAPVDTTGIIPSSVTQGTTDVKKDKRPWQRIIQQEFGWASAYIGIDPTVDEALGQLARGEIDGTRFDAKIRSSEWWKNTNDFIRQWDLKERTPGSTATKEIGDRVQAMQDYALGQFGVALPSESLQAFARESLRQGMQQNIWQNGVGSIIVKGDNVGAVDQLRSGAVGQTLRKINSDYGYEASTDFLNKSIANVVTGQMTTASYRDQVLKQVKSLYGADVGELLDQGYSVADIAQPYNQVAARTLEVDMVDMTDPKFRAALDFTDDKGNRRRMTLGEWERRLRTDTQYGWSKTEQAKDLARNAASTILRAFGKVQ
jgi:hypothetical protein